MDEDGPHDGDAGINTLKINEKFAQRHEYNERRKILEKNKDRIYEASESSSSSEEDSDAELLNPTVEKKFLQLVEAIRRNDPQLKQSDKPLFDDDDFNADDLYDSESGEENLDYESEDEDSGNGGS